MTAATIFRALNRIVVPLLRSPLHRLASRHLMMITYPGRRSGRTYTFAIDYFPWADGQMLSFSSRSWWTNLLGGATARLLLRGRRHEATATLKTTLIRFRLIDGTTP